MNAETISVLTRVSQAVNACVNLPAQTVLGLWSHRVADGEHSLLAAATLSFHNWPWCHARTRGAASPCRGNQGPPTTTTTTGHCVPPSPAPNIWHNRFLCFTFSTFFTVLHIDRYLFLFRTLPGHYVDIFFYPSTIPCPATQAKKQCKFKHLLHKSSKSGGFPAVRDHATLGYVRSHLGWNAAPEPPHA